MPAICPHCRAAMRPDASTCGACGKQPVTDRWEIGANLALATTRVGRKMQAEQFQAESRLAFVLLLGLALLESAAFAGLALLGTSARTASVSNALFWYTGFSATIALVAALWSRRDTYAAGIVALVANAAALSLGFAFDPTDLLRGLPIKLVVLAVAARVLIAGVRTRHVKKLFDADPAHARDFTQRFKAAG